MTNHPVINLPVISVACDLNKKTKPKRAEMINVVLAEDNNELAATITENIAAAGGAFVSSRASNGHEALDKVMQSMPQVLLIDFNLPLLNGAEVTKQLKTMAPNMRVLLFTVGDNPNDIITALGCGADGFILGDLSSARLGPAIKAIVSGIQWIDPEISSKVLRQSVHAAGPAVRRGPDTTVKQANNEKLEHADFLETLAGVYMQEKKYDEAEALFHGAVALAEKSYGKDSNEVATVSTKLADLYVSRQKSAAAEKLYLRALEIRFQTLGQEHVEVAASLENLATLFKMGGGYSEAERFYLWAIRIREKLGPEKDEALAATFSRLARVYRDMGRESEAEQMENRASNIREDLLSKTTFM
jgi:DNA-binding NarL/FixJ family response regulator